jgi:hypothetical protein
VRDRLSCKPALLQSQLFTSDSYASGIHGQSGCCLFVRSTVGTAVIANLMSTG